MFTSPSDPAQTQMYSTEIKIQTNPQHSFWTDSDGPQLTGFHTEPEPVIVPHQELFCSGQSSHLLFSEDNTDFRLDLSSFFGGTDDPLQRNWTSSDPWKEEHRGIGGVKEGAKPSGWSGRAGVLGGVVQRVQAKYDTTFRLDTTFSCSPERQSKSVSRSMSVYPSVHFSDRQPVCSSLSPPPDFLFWNPTKNVSSSSSTASSNYGTKCCIGQERKRSADAAGFAFSLFLPCSETSINQIRHVCLCLFAVLTPLKKGRLSYERVPGRSDGQTRLKLF